MRVVIHDANVSDGSLPSRAYLDACVLNFMLDHPDQIEDGTPCRDVDGGEGAELEALHSLWLAGRRGVWQLVVSPNTYFKVVRTRDRAELSALDSWFQELWQYRRSTVEAMKDLRTFVDAEETRVRMLASGVLGCLARRQLDLPVALRRPICYSDGTVASQDLLPISESEGGAHVGDQCGGATRVGAGGWRALSRGHRGRETADLG